MEDSVHQHVLESAAHLQDGLAHAKQVPHIPQAGRHGKLEQHQDQAGVSRKGQVHASVLVLQVGPELVKQVCKGLNPHSKGINSLLIISVMVHQVLPPLLTGMVGPEAVGQETLEGDDGQAMASWSTLLASLAVH
ncbi:hypothetical protein Y1Q_0015585 [Alligator mississippiensis]|uniref:Uncharacterized protein n=1 Tax=Alligator mississippiensis TaxID=8496 RepID=A0A151NNG8_ALLMI|nr:hypothetical protein Y1Q_0015585 [Alligator mississippiensis]